MNNDRRFEGYHSKIRLKLRTKSQMFVESSTFDAMDVALVVFTVRDVFMDGLPFVWPSPPGGPFPCSDSASFILGHPTSIFFE